jgi:hypothetical protein
MLWARQGVKKKTGGSCPLEPPATQEGYMNATDRRLQTTSALCHKSLTNLENGANLAFKTPPDRPAQPKGYDPDTLPVDKQGESEGLLWMKNLQIKLLKKS